MFVTLPHTRGDYLFPEWFPEEEDGRAFVETRVEISGIQDFPTLLVRDWISKFEKSSPACLIFYQFLQATKSERHGDFCVSRFSPPYQMLTIQFATTKLAHEFVGDFSTDAQCQDMQLSLAKIRDPLSRGMITAVGLGA